MNWLSYKRDCRYFRSDRPCAPHKASGVTCGKCDFYDACSHNILILKFDAIGDVVRTTSILHGIKAKYPASRITWYTKRNCADLFLNNPAVDQLLFLEDNSASWLLGAQSWDIIYGLDASPLCASISASLRARERVGYSLDDKGIPMPINPEAAAWMEMGLHDQIKKNNQKSFFEHLFHYACLDWSPDYRPQIILDESELLEVAAFRADFLGDRSKLVGINPGAGERWRYKRWTETGFAQLIDQLNKINGVRVVLLGGEADQPIIEDILSRCSTRNEVAHARPGTVRTFIKYIDTLDLLVCGDTMALHLATAREKAIVSLFGPTSAAEIDLFRIGEKIISSIECQGCYLPDCDKDPTCMDLISVGAVYQAVVKYLPQTAAGAPIAPSAEA